MSKLKVWYVDDDAEMRHAVSLMLTMLGHTMQCFTDARLAAKKLLAGERPDLLLLDISMPEVSGIDMLEFVRRRPEWKALPVLMLSSEAADAQVDQALALGANGFIAKPVMLDELEQAIDQVIQHHRSTD